MSQDFSTWCEQRRAYHGEKFDASTLDKRFIPYFESGERIRVRMHGKEHFGAVGVTAGWRPVFLLMRRVTDCDSCRELCESAEILAVQRNGRYVTVHG